VLRGRLGNRDVAVKRFTIARSEDLARFRSELALMSELSHPAICPVLAANALPPAYLLVMPLAAGTLHGRLHRQGWRPSWAELLEIGAALADALAAVHARGVVHRDVKPANVLAFDDGRHVLSDFGLASPADQLVKDANVTQAALRSRGMPSGEGRGGPWAGRLVAVVTLG
jgi:serine/threonine protein kinase